MTWSSQWLVCISIASLMLSCCLTQALSAHDTAGPPTPAPFQLTSTPAHVVSQVTHNVTLRCDHGGLTPSQLDAVNWIRVLKKSATSGWQLMAEMRDLEPEPHANLNVSVSARISRNVQDSFLQVTWPVATQDTFGTYRCEVLGFERYNLNFATEMTSMVTIRKENVTSGDMLDIFKETQHDLSSIADATNKLIQNMGILNEKLNFFRDKLDGQDEDVHALGKKFSLSRKSLAFVSGNVTNLSAIISSLVNKVNALNETTVTTSELSEHITSLSNNINSVNRRMDRVEEKMDSYSESLKEKLSALEQKDAALSGKLIDTQNKDDNLHTELASVKSELASLREVNHLLIDSLHPWPEGQFALLEPRTGCPKDPVFPGKQDKYFKFHSESSSGSTNSNEDPSSILPVGSISRDGSQNYFTLWFCESSEHNTTRLWPLGSYCINKLGREDCPRGLTDSALFLDAEDSSYVVSYSQLLFCCMQTGDADSPIVLPTRSPFLLYRRGGQCQKVYGMNVATVTISIDTEDDRNNDVKTNDGPDVDINHRDPLKLYLCSYT